MYLNHDRGPSWVFSSSIILATLALVSAGALNRDQTTQQKQEAPPTVPAECLPPPTWTVDGGRNLMEESKGNVTVVALLAASCPFCIRQAFLLTALKDELTREGIAANFLIVNEDTPMSKALIWKLTSAVRGFIPVYQEKRASEPVWDTLNGIKDDFLIYDRCGRLTFHLSLPMSKLTHPNQYVKRAIVHTFSDGVCGECNLPKGDEPLLDDMEENPFALDLSQQQIELDIDQPMFRSPQQQESASQAIDDNAIEVSKEPEQLIPRRLDDMDEDPVFSDFTGEDDKQQEPESLSTAFINPRLDEVTEVDEPQQGGFPVVDSQQIENFMAGWSQMLPAVPSQQPEDKNELLTTSQSKSDQEFLDTDIKVPVIVLPNSANGVKYEPTPVPATWSMPGNEKPVENDEKTILAAVGEIRENDNLIDTEGKTIGKDGSVFSVKPFHLPARARWLKRRRPYIDYPSKASRYPYYWRIPTTKKDETIDDQIESNILKKPNWESWKDSDDDMWSQTHEKPVWVADIRGKGVKMHRSYADFQKSIRPKPRQPSWYVMTPRTLDTDSKIREEPVPFPEFPEENGSNKEEASRPSEVADIPVTALPTEISTPSRELPEKPMKKWQLKKMRIASQVKKMKAEKKAQRPKTVPDENGQPVFVDSKYDKDADKTSGKGKNLLDAEISTFQKV